MNEQAGRRQVMEWGVGWMIRLRWVAVAGMAAAPAVARWLGVSLPAGAFLGLAAAVAAYNAALTLWTRPGQAVPHLAIHAQIVADLIALTAVFHFSGGIENPLLPMYAFHVVIAAIVLSQAASLAYAVLAVLMAAALALGEQQGLLVHVPLTGIIPGGLHENPSFVRATLAGVAVVLLLMAYLASVIGVALRRREDDLLRVARALAGQDRQKSQYVVMLAHSILVRLENIDRALTTAVRELPPALPDASRGMLARVSQWLAGLRTLVQDVLDLSRIRAAGELVMSFIYVPRLVYQEVEDLRPLAAQRDVRLVVEIPGHVTPIRGNAAALSQALSNLLRNAVAYSPSGGAVRVSIAEHRGGVQVSVQDEGIGIAAEDLPHIFEEFYRAEAAREMDPTGRGLGLAIVKYVVEQHGGEVRAESAQGKGSRFTMWLPAAAVAAAASEASEPTYPKTA